MDSLVDVERRYKRDADVRDMGDVLQKTVRHHQSSILSLLNYSTVDNEKKKRNKRDERNIQFGAGRVHAYPRYYEFRHNFLRKAPMHKSSVHPTRKVLNTPDDNCMPGDVDPLSIIFLGHVV